MFLQGDAIVLYFDALVRHSRRPGVFIVNFEHISHLILVFLVLTFSRKMPAG